MFLIDLLNVFNNYFPSVNPSQFQENNAVATGIPLLYKHMKFVKFVATAATSFTVPDQID